ncbi:MAG: hypothetical protein WAU91_06940 [Desulfatitalea sp.]
MKTILSPALAIIGLLIVTSIACSEEPMHRESTNYQSIDEVPMEKWNQLSRKRIFFGHQSVGFNIMEGIKDLMKTHPQIKLELVETRNADDLKNGVFAHAQVGKNQDPLLKIADFTEVLNAGIGKKVDFALLKFCYVDITNETDVPALFEAYKNKLAELESKYPETTFIHLTEPLTSVQINWKTKLKKLLGKKLGEYQNTIKRNEYNELLLREYQGKAPVIDIAAIESTRPDGTREGIQQDKRFYYAMVQDYTSDGGHLNETGRKKVAERFILLLVNLS